jgi:hypothetical protein
LRFKKMSKNQVINSFALKLYHKIATNKRKRIKYHDFS